ncbi:MAG: hypothetical protein V1898_04990 [Patescibacteria group bacterium]
MNTQDQINNFANLSEQEKINLAKQSVGEYLQIMEHLTKEEKNLLSKALEDIEDENIEQIKQQIMNID